jgi:putative endonuclease
MNPRGWLTRLLGDEGERLAARHLKRLGYRILARQAKSELGEIDLITLDGDTIVFVEVKSRRHDREGSPAEAVDLRKQRKLTQLALAWLKRNKLLGRRSRFDVIAIRWNDQGQPVVEHFRSAFEAVELGQMY